MSPLQHRGDGATVHDSWQSWIDEVIAEARERGEFDDLPGVGRPLRIAENPFAGEWELAFHVLENAEMKPPGMEMTREIREGLAELAMLRERARECYERGQSAPVAQERETPPRSPSRFRWWPFRRRELSGLIDVNDEAAHLAALETERRWACRDYLAKAAKLDEVIAAYNAWLPDTLRRLQKPRLPAHRAAAAFDAAWPPLGGASTGDTDG
jgi:hypothetical protein